MILPGICITALNKKKYSYPKVIASANNRQTTGASAHSITLPSGANVGNMLLVFFTAVGNNFPTVNTTVSGNNWISLDRQQHGANVTGRIFYKIAEGSDALTIFTANSTGGAVSNTSAHTSYLIYGANGVSRTASNANSTNSDPPNHNPGAGAKEFLWFASRHARSNTTTTGAPTNYTNLLVQPAANTIGCVTATAYRLFDSANDNPGTFTSTSNNWVAFTTAVTPGPTLTPPGAFADAGWALIAGDEQISVDIITLPESNWTITDIEYRLDDGSWTSTGGVVDFNLTSLTNDQPYNIEIRAVNGYGKGRGSSIKTETPEEAGAPTGSTDDFNRADGALGSNWTQDGWHTGTLSIVSNQVPMPSSGEGVYSYNGTFSQNQYSQIVIDNIGSWSDDLPGVMVRHSQVGGITKFYAAVVSQYFDGYLRIIKFNESGGFETLLYDSGISGGRTFVDDDVLRIESVDESTNVRLNVYVNGSLIQSSLDTSGVITGGNPGLYSAPKGPTGPTADSWEGGDL